LVRTTGKFSWPAPGSFLPTDARRSEVWQRVPEAAVRVVCDEDEPVEPVEPVDAAGAAGVVAAEVPDVPLWVAEAGPAVPGRVWGAEAVLLPPAPQAVSRPTRTAPPAVRAPLRKIAMSALLENQTLSRHQCPMLGGGK
jgi:hypothetical protein